MDRTKKKRLSIRETVYVASMLFGMFFGAGNLIFPIYMGQLAGRNMWQAAAGFLITGVGLPLLGVAALGISRLGGLLEVSSQVGRRYGMFFTCLLYLTIGPFFAIPRCATVSFTVGLEGFLAPQNVQMVLAAFSFVFFGLTLLLSLRPGEILTWIGKVLNPLFLFFLGILVLRALFSPMGQVSEAASMGAYETEAFFTGILEGYNTMDALAGLAFGIVVVQVIQGLGVTDAEDVAKNTVKAGLISSLLMAVIYVLVTLVGAQSRGVFAVAANGGEVFAMVADYYFGRTGALILAVTVTVACLKTSVGLVTSCGETFVKLFPHGPSYQVWAVMFSLVSFLIANLGLDLIIRYSLPVLMFLYPLAVTLILLTIFGKCFDNDRLVYGWVTALTAVAAVADGLRALPKETIEASGIGSFLEKAEQLLPFSDLGFGWVCPALLGLCIGLVLHMRKKTGKTTLHF